MSVGKFMVSKAEKKVDRCNVCNGVLKPAKEKISGVMISYFKCVDCGEGEVPIFEAMKLDSPAARARAAHTPSSSTTA